MKTENLIDENFDFGIDSRYISEKEKHSESVGLMKARLDRMRKLSKEQIILAKLMQLKLKMENYLREPLNDDSNRFTYFLENYIDSIYSKRTEFAKDVDITPVLLSQILNHHREPKHEFLLKLMIHSKIAYKSITNFEERTWYQVYYQEKINETMSKQNEWRPKIQQHVKINAINFS
jgi:hypothetical protein